MNIDVSLVRNLIATQFPQWSELPVAPVARSGCDNRTFRLGQDMCVRLPSAECYAAQVEKEHRWLSQLAPRLPLPIPVPVAKGSPSEELPWNWSIYRWLDGEDATIGRVDDLNCFAETLADFLVALQQIDPTDGPAPGLHNFFRGGSLSTCDRETRLAIASLGSTIDVEGATDVWETALQSTWHGPPVWLHGDIHPSNLLVCNDRLHAVIDFGCCAVGDPACDLTIAWTFFAGESHERFRSKISADKATWERSRGWALWKALITLVENDDSTPSAQTAPRAIHSVLAEHCRGE